MDLTNSLVKAKQNVFRIILISVLLVFLVSCSEPVGMDAPFSSTTTEVYNETMKTIESQVTAAQFQELKGAINYLNMKSTNFSGLEEFRQSLDSSTAAKIIKQANDLKASKQKEASG